MMEERPCFTLVRSFTSWYAFLLLFFFRLFSISLHWSSIHVSLAFLMLFLITWLISLYCFAPSTSDFFFNSQRLSHRSSMSVVTQGFFGRRCLTRISLTVWVTAMLNVSIILSIDVFSVLRSNSNDNFPPILAWKASKTSVFYLVQVELDSCGVLFVNFY